MEYPYFKGLEADRYSFYRVPKALVKADLFQKMSGDAKLLYAVLLDRMSLSIKNGWQDKHGNAYIICTIEEVMDSIHCARQKAVKLLDELEQEFRLIERRRQGLCKPNLLYVKDLYAGLSQSNYWKYENHTSGGMKNELPGVPKSNGSNTEKINKTDNSETDLIYPAELQEEEQYRRYFKEALELEILEQGYPADKTVLYEILELLVEKLEGIVYSTMGKKAAPIFANYILTIFMFIFLSNISGLFGLRPPTADYGTTFALGLITFFLIHITQFKNIPGKQIWKDMCSPLPPWLPIWLPINLISEIAVPISLSLRLFANVLSGTVMMALVYGLLSKLAVIWPAALHLYFDLFSGAIQTYVFCMLTMTYIGQNYEAE